MQNTTTTTAVILETRFPLKDGRYPVKLRVTHSRVQRYFSLRDKHGKKITMLEDEFESVTGKKPRGENKEIAVYLNELESAAIDTIKELSVFSFEGFEKRFFGGHGDDQDLFTALKNSADRLKSENRIGTAKLYECSLNSFKKFTGKNILFFEKVNLDLLNKYEKWMLENKNTLSTIGVYLRNIRTCFNEAIREGLIKNELYPFSRNRNDHKYEIPAGSNVKKAISENEIGLIASYPTIDGTSEQRYRDYWLFLFLCNGINVTDFAKLKYENIQDDVIVFHRQKTKRKLRKKPRAVKVVISQALGRIIDRWGDKPALPEEYIFPILKSGMTAEQELEKTHQTIKLINKYADRIGKAVGIKNGITSYTARHSFATILKYRGASTAFISESLGHSNLQTTESYLADFEIKEKRKWAAVVEQAIRGDN
ncbi:MAG: site-specific integrase [Bacteroidetes bacterium]|nr:site-specific integrase [Bacteroidota bacterium]